MRRARWGRVVALGLVASAAVGTVGATPARADCVEVDFEVRYDHQNQPSWYPLGGPDYCVTPTPWPRMVEWWIERDFTDPQPGLPNYVWFHIWVPVP